MWNKVKVHPWVGPQYENPIIFPYKTLILGESNYTSEEKFNSNLVIECIADHIGQNEDPNFSRFATKARRVVFGRNTTISSKLFWENAAFYNFVQCLVGSASRERPSEKMWSESVQAFNELICTLKPERILVLGLENWKNLLAHLNHKKMGEHMAALNINGQEVIAGYIIHPSYGGGFSYDEWHPIASQILLQP